MGKIEGDTRRGFVLPEGESKLDRVVKLSGIAETLDGPAIKLADNVGLEMAKKKIVEKWGVDILPDIYGVVDMIIDAIPEPAE
jgi:hypothetical protein